MTTAVVAQNPPDGGLHVESGFSRIRIEECR
jgi:hypothetical protein